MTIELYVHFEHEYALCSAGKPIEEIVSGLQDYFNNVSLSDDTSIKEHFNIYSKNNEIYKIKKSKESPSKGVISITGTPGKFEVIDALDFIKETRANSIKRQEELLYANDLIEKSAYN